MNKLIKKVLVGITAATMMFGSVCTAYAATDLGWKAERGLQDMMQDTWRWQSKNPNGYT